uniref:Uncharacterized protein LOC116955684 isoform X2 n=1 Tax=Petromyzon marinus TaxID=7757 RepID=A0AAJ7XGW3_PETMA|nr:uncharacterized protein LOC116955684 isoform X2 [Petromyzon marinus]
MLKPVASKLTGKCVVLASASPRRRDILTNIGLKFEVVPSWYSEDLSKAEYPAPYAYATETAVRKALEVAKRMHERHQKTPDLVIGADTVVAIDGDILEKPADKPDAYRMLSRLSGREHSVFTGVALVECCVCEGKLQTSVVQFHEETRVKFAELSEELLWDYIDSGEPMDKAGGYGIQALGGMFVESIHGDFLNVVGLPLHHIFRKLGEHYIDEAATEREPRRRANAAMGDSERDVDVLIVGSGPHALTLLTLLRNPGSRPWDSLSGLFGGLKLSAAAKGRGGSGGRRAGGRRRGPGAVKEMEEAGGSRGTAADGRSEEVEPALASLGLEEKAAEDGEETPLGPQLLEVMVVDTYGQWLVQWDKQFTALNIPHLRSHALVHTDPFDKRALQVFATQQRREGELRALPRRLHILDENAFFNDGRVGKRERRLLSAGGCARQNELYFTLPSTRLFRDFFTHQDRPFWEGLPTGRRLKGHRSGPMAVPTVNDGQPRQLSVAGTGMGAGFVGKTSEALCIKIEHYSLAGAVTAGTVDAILPVLAAAGGGGGDGGGDGGPIVDYFQVTLKGGSTVRAHHVVLAAGPTRAAMAVVPDWVSSIGERFPEDRLLHTTEFISRAGGSVANVVSEPDEHVLVVGGGLSSAHMVLLAVEAGASSVTWVMRKHLQVKQFDVGDVETLVGRYAHREHGVRLDGLPFLRQFYAERGPRRRLDMIRQARKGGAVTPEAYGQIRPLIEAGIVSLRAYCQVESASWSYKEQRWRVVLSTGKETWSGDRIWLATGCKLDVAQDPLLANVLRHFPVPLVEGWPAIDDDLRWATGCELYLMGQYAALKVGPHAVNLAGGQAASARIAKAILQKHREEQQEDSSSRAQEFIDHMHGLMWC